MVKSLLEANMFKHFRERIGRGQDNNLKGVN